MLIKLVIASGGRPRQKHRKNSPFKKRNPGDELRNPEGCFFKEKGHLR